MSKYFKSAKNFLYRNLFKVNITPEQREYFKSLLNVQHPIGSHNSKLETRKKLGYYMKQLKESSHNDDIVDDLLQKIHSEMKLDITIEDFKQQYLLYLRILADREDYRETKNYEACFFGLSKKLGPIPMLQKEKWNMWGSHKQFLCGKLIIDGLNKEHGYGLHEIWGCLLNPTGGIIGPGNKELISTEWNSPISMHACMHDASGYLLNYHGLGKGYNYLDTWKTAFPTSSPLSCQYAGILCWMTL